VDAEIAKRVIKNLESCGCQELVSMKTDQESAIRSLVEEVKRQRTSETLVELAKRYDSQSNGIAERSVQSVEGQVRTLKLALEQHLNGKISVPHVIMTWMVEHAADLLNKFAVGEDGRTAYERIKGKKYSGEALEFGRTILYRIPCKPEGGNMSERWVPGIWLGKRSVSDEHVVGLEDGSVCVTSAVRMQLDSESWDIEFVNKLRGTPARPAGREPEDQGDAGGGVVIPAGLPLDPGHPEPPKPKRPEGMAREFAIRRGHLTKYGYTVGCAACRAIRAGATPHKGHTGGCRERLTNAMKEDGDTAEKDKAEERKIRFIEREKEKADRDAKRARRGDGDGDESMVAPPVETGITPGSSSSASSSGLPMVSTVPVGGGIENNHPLVMDDIEDEEGKEAPEKKRVRDPGEDEEEAERVGQYRTVATVTSKCKPARPLHDSHSVGTQFRKILSHNPVTGSRWTLTAKKDIAIAIDFVNKWKPKILHLEPHRPEQMIAVGKLAGEQRKHGREFVVSSSVSSEVWCSEAGRLLTRNEEVFQVIVGSSSSLGARVRAATSDRVLEDRVRNCRRHGGGCFPRDSLRRIVSEVTEMKMNARRDKVELYSMDVRGGGLHEADHPEGHFIDDIDGTVLDAKKVRVARMSEMKTFEEMKVYTYARREEARSRGKIVGVRWVDTKKGERMKSRLVAQEFAHGDRDDIFAATPPLMASRFVISNAASRGRRGDTTRRLCVMDVKRAFLYGDIEEEIYIELPDEDPMKAKGYVGKLVKAMYGTRSAPLIWQKVVRRKMKEMGFSASTTIPCLYYHLEKDMYVVAHVDDFLMSGEQRDIEWAKRGLEKEFGLTYSLLVPGSRVSYLGRTIAWTPSGITFEGENKYIGTMAKEWELLGSSGASTPGCDEDKREEGGDELLSNEAATKFRRAAAMVNYMSQDSPDLSFASKELSRGMANPTQKDVVKLRRCIKYLVKHPRRQFLYRWQDAPNIVTVFSDSDWAGCTRTRKSTSGGVMMVGAHAIHHWSSTQSVVALSSAEAELNAVVKSVSELLGLKNALEEFGIDMKVEVCTDSSAANGIVHRQGCGKVKHLECRQLWVQSKITGGDVICRKIPREENPGDAFTHYWNLKDGHKHFGSIGCIRDLDT